MWLFATVVQTVAYKNVAGTPPEPNEAEVKGTVSAIASRSCATNTVVFTVTSSGTSTMVTTNASTKFENTTCATLAVNDKVELKGTFWRGYVTVHVTVPLNRSGPHTRHEGGARFSSSCLPSELEDVFIELWGDEESSVAQVFERRFNALE